FRIGNAKRLGPVADLPVLFEADALSVFRGLVFQAVGHDSSPPIPPASQACRQSVKVAQIVPERALKSTRPTQSMRGPGGSTMVWESLVRVRLLFDGLRGFRGRFQGCHDRLGLRAAIGRFVAPIGGL